MQERRIVYLSGSITGNDNCKENFACAERFMTQMGFAVISPVKVGEELPDLTYEQYMHICYRLIDIADIIFMVSGWQKSKSANAELSYAKSLGKKTMYQEYYYPFRKAAENEDGSKGNIE